MKLKFSKGSTILNEEQYKVVISPLENQRILASAGSGKTSTITARIAYLVEEYQMDPSRILLITFSRAAAEEMIHRVYNLIGPVPIYSGTFHAISAQILKENAPQLIADQPFLDEIPYRCVKWLETEKGKKWSKRFHTIMVDEFQDCNEIQWKLVKAIYHPWSHITIVGDDAQNIYTWRGSSVDYILDFHNRIPFVKDYQLFTNYRSTEAIVTIANSTMRFIPTLPFKEKMIANQKGGRKPEVHFFLRASDECDWIVGCVHQFYRDNKEKNITIAIISRYHSDLYKIEERLHKKFIPYKLLISHDIRNKNKKKEKGEEEEKEKGEEEKEEKKVILTTIHSSKGLEWDIVFFMNLHDDIFPSRKTEQEIICERRLFYVAITRAKKVLFLTYSRSERSISRFVREIPRPFLTYHNVVSFQFSLNSFEQPLMSVEDMIRGLDGSDWIEMRKKGLPLLNTPIEENCYPFGKWYHVPEWVKQYDIYDTWKEWIRWVIIREGAKLKSDLSILCTQEIRDTLLTLRIYQEDLLFWETYEAEMEHLVYHFLSHTHNMPPIEYIQLEEYIQQKFPHLQIQWSLQDLCQANVILAKIRGQLRPLRHFGFDLKEFSFGRVSHTVPTELRPQVLESWHKVINQSLPTHEIMADIWRMATLKSVRNGRNLPLFQTAMIRPFLEEIQEIQEMVIQMEKVLPIWFLSQQDTHFQVNLSVKGIAPISLDVVTTHGLYEITFDTYPIHMEDKIILLLKQFCSSFCRVGWINAATGIITEYQITPTIQEQLRHMWQHLQRKYTLSLSFQENKYFSLLSEV